MRSASTLYSNQGEKAKDSQPKELTVAGVPDNRIEILVANVWAEILAVEQVDRAADFFRCGGDSLLATRAITRLNALCGIQLPLRSLFETPTVAGLAAQIQALSVSTSSAPIETSSLGSSDHEVMSVLSFSQERMWFMHALAAASAAYHVPVAIRLRGALDESALQSALQQVVQRHDVLRTSFIGHNSGIVQKASPMGAPQLTRMAFDAPGGNVDVERVSTYLTELTNGTFDLSQGPLLRGALVRLAADDWVLLLVMHHIVCDQWSTDVLLRELAGFYRQAVTGATYTAPQLPISYTAYAQWHRRWFKKRRRNELSYWKAKLAGLEPTVLNTDYARPPQQSFRGARLRLDFDPHEIASLTELAATHRSTLAMVLITALKVLLHRHTGRTDIAIGVPIANRHRAAAEPLVGTLVNTLVFRTDLGGDPDFPAALQRVREVALEAFEHQDTPFELMVKELQLPRDASRSPLFSVLFNMLNTPLGTLEFEGLSWSRFNFDRKAAQFDLTVTVDAAYDHSICFEYSRDLFAPATICRLADHYMNLLRAVLTMHSTHISALPLMSVVEDRLIREWVSGRTLEHGARTVPSLLELTCKRAPKSVALTAEDLFFTYEELDAASTRLAGALHARGIGRGSRVGLCLQRSPQLIIAQWASLKSGAAYVPLDPSYPRERLAFMARDAQLSLLLTDANLAQYIDWNGPADSVLDIDAELSLEQSTTRTLVADLLPRPEDPAYVIYTSGSTGQPKGVVVPHRAVVNFLASMASEPGLSASDRVLAVTTLSFDIAVLELLLPFSVGARVILARQDQVLDGEALRKLIEEHDVTLLQATPSTWRLLIDANWPGSRKLKALVGGEPLSRELAGELLTRCGEVWNMYGPTETTVWSTCWKVAALERDGVSLGRPIANTQVHVLDEQHQLCPIGVPGEIFIGGMGLALGYFERPELTAQRFVAGPPAAGTGRLYRTGDRARWRHDGALEHLGRLDNQIKIRGHRIEMGEIESRLNRHPGVAHALVVTREERPEDVRLVAYVVPNGSMPDAAVLRTYLREWLPDYMLPQSFVALDAVPTLPNGKTDFKRLPLPQHESSPPAHVGPRSSIEEALWKIWRDLLNTEGFDVHDNFFDLGGHSILTVRLVSIIRTDLRRACTLPMVFRHPTIAALASALESASQLEENSLVSLQPLGEAPPVFCICGIQIYQELANRLGPDIPVYGAYVPMEMDYVTPQTKGAVLPAVKRLAAEYLKTVRARQPQGPYRLVGFSFGGVLAYEMAQQLTRAGERVTLLAILDSDVPDRRTKARPARFEQRLRLLKQRLSGQIKDRFHRFSSGNSTDDQHVTAARDERYLAAMRSYTAEPYAGPVLYVETTDVPVYNPGYGWRALIGNLQTCRLAGDHLGLLKEPNVDLLAQMLRSRLDAS